MLRLHAPQTGSLEDGDPTVSLRQATSKVVLSPRIGSCGAEAQASDALSACPRAQASARSGVLSCAGRLLGGTDDAHLSRTAGEEEPPSSHKALRGPFGHVSATPVSQDPHADQVSLASRSAKVSGRATVSYLPGKPPPPRWAPSRPAPPVVTRSARRRSSGWVVRRTVSSSPGGGMNRPEGPRPAQDMRHSQRALRSHLSESRTRQSPAALARLCSSREIRPEPGANVCAGPELFRVGAVAARAGVPPVGCAGFESATSCLTSR